MDKKTIIVRLAALMSALAETTKPGETMQASLLYLALGHDIDAYRVISNVGERLGWLRVTTTAIALTSAGRVKAQQFQTAGI